MASSGHRAERRDGNRRFVERRRPLIIGAVVVVGLVALWSGSRLISARGHLADAQRSAEALKSAVQQTDEGASSQALAGVQSSVGSARRALNDPTLVIASHVPILGRNVAAPRAVANILDGVAQDTLPGLVTLAGQVTPSKIMSGDGRVNLDILKSTRGDLEKASAALDDAEDRLDDINTGWTLPPIGHGVGQVQKAVGDAADAVGTGAVLARIGPTMLGDRSPQHYLLVTQNNAEIRATGGLPGAWAEVIATDGKLTLGKQGSSAQMNESMDPVDDQSIEELVNFTDKLVTDFRDVNFTPEWPRAAQIAAAMAKKRVGLDVDGVVALDPVSLSYLLRATGPIQPAVGDALTADNAISTLLNGTYLKYPDDNAKQDAYFAAATKAVFDAITRPGIDTKALGEGLAKATDERRLMLWSAHESIQEELKGTAIAHELHSGESDDPQIGFYLSDAMGSKMDYYLSYDSTVEATKCSRDGVQTYKATLTLQSSAPADAAQLPKYVTGGGDRGPGFKPGDLTVTVSIFAPDQGKVTDVTFRGEPKTPNQATFGTAVWKDRGVGRTTITLTPGQTRTLDITMTTGKDHTGDAEVTMTPSVKPNTPTAYTVESAC